MQTYYILLLIL